MKFQFKGTTSHDKPIIEIRWSPDGTHLASVGLDNKLILWNTKSQKSIKSWRVPKNPCSLSWGKSDSDQFNIVIGSDSGDIIHFDSVVEPPKQSYLDDMADEFDDDSEIEGAQKEAKKLAPYNESEDEGDDVGMSGSEGEEDLTGLFEAEDDFVIDNDSQGYAEPSRNKKRALTPTTEGLDKKRTKVSFNTRNIDVSLFTLEPFSVGSTPWNSNRRYLTITPIGYSWSVEQGGYNTITVSFFDRSLHREYHFRDSAQMELASMNEDGIFLASSAQLCLFAHQLDLLEDIVFLVDLKE
ncbi:unnamed protein product [Ambrosiozyma monospora]|uniref:Unnamed protein product n=1 Tax=Ambrosiozyma monospora TaxID=43982 RepID=A0ACB5U165_AMBMO|nr:unnamed protein product [Ambrosiozyma monospora]